MKKKYLLLIVFVAIIVRVAIVNTNKPSNNVQDTTTQDQTQDLISLTITDGSDSKTYQTKATKGTVYELLKMVAIDESIELLVEDFDFGTFVKSIGGKEGTAEKSWIYFVNGESGQVGADQYQLKAGDKVEWKYITPTF